MQIVSTENLKAKNKTKFCMTVISQYLPQVHKTKNHLIVCFPELWNTVIKAIIFNSISEFIIGV